MSGDYEIINHWFYTVVKKFISSYSKILIIIS